MDDEKTSQNHIQGLERGLAVLTEFDADRPNPAVAELATARAVPPGRAPESC
ncbi:MULTISPECIES: hypothetical protein [Amycolatopsis methanolica group]|uniref:hypothetical protein n=1 Tax=Amycolatopsis methanolica group TaxID=2893674 RepID=UPI003423DAA9